MKSVEWGFVIIFFFFSLNSISSADKSVYLYDDTDILTRVLKDTEVLSYQYDHFRNLVSINKNTVSANSPVLQSVNSYMKIIYIKSVGEWI